MVILPFLMSTFKSRNGISLILYPFLHFCCCFHRKPVLRNCLHFFKIFKKQCVVERLIKVNLLPEMLLLPIFLHYKVKENQNMIKEPFFGTPRGLLTCLLILTSERREWAVFQTNLVLAIFWPLLVAFRKSN